MVLTYRDFPTSWHGYPSSLYLLQGIVFCVGAAEKRSELSFKGTNLNIHDILPPHLSLLLALYTWPYVPRPIFCPSKSNNCSTFSLFLDNRSRKSTSISSEQLQYYTKFPRCFVLFEYLEQPHPLIVATGNVYRRPTACSLRTFACGEELSGLPTHLEAQVALHRDRSPEGGKIVLWKGAPVGRTR